MKVTTNTTQVWDKKWLSKFLFETIDSQYVVGLIRKKKFWDVILACASMKCKKMKWRVIISIKKWASLFVTLIWIRLIIEHSSFDDLSYDDLKLLNLFYGYESHLE